LGQQEVKRMKTMIKPNVGLVAALVLTTLGGCSSQRVKPVSAPDIVAKTEPDVGFEARSACGNDSRYSINGKQYQVLASAKNYVEDGTAAWYGAEYQGSETAGCEKFDMYAYSAAHRTLPIPSFVRVTHKQTGKSIIVRINDRGPFETQDIIQLSFAAANALGIKSPSGAPVRVEALSPDQFKGQFSGVVAYSQQDGRNLQGKVSSSTLSEFERQKQKSAAKSGDKVYYVVAGTWPERNAAIDMFVRLSSVGLAKTEMATVQEAGRALHQVRIGPLYNQDQIDNVKDTLQSNGLANFRLVEQ
jgi:rare lipoprotein A